MLKKYSRFTIRFRVLIVILVLILTGLGGYFARRVTFSSRLTDLAPEDNKELVALQKTLQMFGSSSFIMISVKAKDPFSYETLTKIKNLGKEIEALPEVEQVIDPINASVFKYLFGMLVLRESFPGGEIPESPEKINQIKRDMLAEPLLRDVVISDSGEALALYIRLKEGIETLRIRDTLDKIIQKYQGPEVFYITGTPIIESWIKDYVRHDTVRLSVPILVLIVIVLFLNFRSIRGVLLTLFIMISSIIWTLGLMGLFNRKITMIGVMLPTLVIIIASSYAIHFLNQYYKDIFVKRGKKDHVELSVKNIGKTIILAAATTMAGFTALILNRIKPMMEMGIFVVIGVFFAMGLTLTFMPAILSMLNVPKKRKHASREGSRFNAAFTRLGDIIIKRWKLVLIGATVLSIVSIAGIHKINVETRWRGFFKKNSDIIKSQTFIKANFGGVSTVHINLSLDKDSGLDFRKLKVLQHVDKIEKWIADQNLLGRSTSLVDYIKRANQLINDNREDAYRLPKNDADLLKIFLMFKMAKFEDNLSNVVTDDYLNTSIIVSSAKKGKIVTIPEMKQFLSDFNQFVANNPYPGMKVSIAGIDLVYLALVEYIVRSQLTSIVLSMIIVFFIISLTFRSFAYGLFGLIPIAFGLLLNFATMSYFNIPLDFITSMIASISVGLGVDNAIHYLIRFTRTDHRLPLDTRLKSALNSSGIPIFFTSFTLIAGFSVLLFSSFKPILYFGLLISVTMLGCLIGVAVILPAFIYFMKPKAILSGTEREPLT